MTSVESKSHGKLALSLAQLGHGLSIQAKQIACLVCTVKDNAEQDAVVLISLLRTPFPLPVSLTCPIYSIRPPYWP